MVKRLILPSLFLAVLLIATPASACENCVRWNGNWTCWSGFETGFAWCYGGWGVECEVGGDCTAPPRPKSVAPADAVCPDGILGCVDAAPAGFALERPAQPAEERKEQS